MDKKLDAERQNTLYLGPEKDKDEMCSSFNFHKIT